MAGASTPNAGHTVKFVGHDATGLPVKRKQVHQACLQCRKRKQLPEAGSEGRVRAARNNSQRPVAAADRDTTDAAAQLLRFFHHASDKASSNSPEDDQIQQPRPMSPAPPFLGDLNPEGILVEATMVPSQKSPPADDESGHQEIGFLPPTPRRQSKDSPTQRQTTTCTGSPKLCEETSGPYFSVPREDGTRLTIHVQDTAKFAAIAQTLVSRGLADKVMPSDAEWKAMRDLYLTKIHPIFPIYEQSALMDLPKERALRELIQASVCLAAATDPETHHLLTFKSHVQGSMSNKVVSFDDYSHDMASFINKRLAELQESRQIPLTNQIQVMALTCMYWQPSNPTERFEPLTLYAKLVSLVHTHGVHLGILARGPSECCIEGRGKRIFKCLYALDRLLGAISARPFMFHNVDLTQVPRPDDQDSPIFRLFISLILLLDQVVEMYRPRPKFNCVDIPVFERMAIEAGAQFEPEGLIVTLEVLYHAIGVLSVRMPRHRFRTAPECDTLQGTTTHHLPPSSMNARRSHSADRILDVIKDYKLSPMPFIPYASTLSLSVAYRKWRFSQLPVFRTRGGADFKKVLPVVQELGAIWTSARINGQLGQCVMLKLDRSEIINRKRARETATGPGTKQARTDLLRGESGREAVAEEQNGAMEQNRVEGDKINSASAPSDGNTRSDATGSSRIPRDRLIHDPTSGSNGSTDLLTSVRDSLPSPVTSSIMERPQQQNLSLTWTTSWTADKTHSNNNGNNSAILANPPSVTPIRDHNPHLNPTQQQPVLAEGYSCIQPDDAIPLPRNALAAQPTGLDTAPLAGLSEGSVEDFLAADDDALFRSWDPRFAQSVDFSFSSILDPGNPFAWPEYCNYTA
ncbi:hypothetical protein C7999DRAFT_15321 [Corynascus novoguineensis]|uniref:Transcription factor domain-containing protein n=1 Tax=Corynascus novoguineensis TaxID=1126955 RepID=A0AAN7CSK8_9PEZI|nr:hypothetical protein C7999DRAFT_15321 [Corynascus novoguineensis]